MKLKSLALPLLAAAFVVALGVNAHAAPRQFKVQLKPGQSVEVTKADGTKETLSAPAGGAEKFVDIPLGATVKNTTPGNRYAATTEVAVWSGDIKFELDGAEGLKVDSTPSGEFKVASTGDPIDIRSPDGGIKIYSYNKDVTFTANGGFSNIEVSGRDNVFTGMGGYGTADASVIAAFNNPLQETTVASPSAP